MGQPSDFLQNENADDVILKNYQVLQEIGVLTHIDKITSQLKDLEALVTEAGEIFNIQDTGELTEYIAQKLLDKFIPSFLAFILQDEFDSDKPYIICYKNMKAVPSPFEIATLEPYKHFFSLSPQSVDFAVFEYMVGSPPLTDLFQPVNPAKVIPITGFDGVHGFIVVGKKVLGEPYNELEMNYLDRLINFASISFQNSLHYKRAIKDIKTELYNHSFFMIRLEEELARIRRYRAQVTLLIFDIDHFKKFNDTYGHLAGDRVLAHVAREISSSVRTEDVPARFGGEEFVVLLIQCNAEYGWMIGERIRKKIEQLKVFYEGQELSVTVSIGIAQASNEAMVNDASSLIQQADKALYSSKSQGRNKTSVFQKEMAEAAINEPSP